MAIAAKQAGYELATIGAINSKTLDAVSRPLIPENAYRNVLNQFIEN